MADIVGSPFTFILWYPTCNVACNCKEGMLLFLVLTGIGIRSQCGHCKKKYYIEGMQASPDGKTLEPSIVVELPESLIIPSRGRLQ